MQLGEHRVSPGNEAIHCSLIRANRQVLSAKISQRNRREDTIDTTAVHSSSVAETKGDEIMATISSPDTC